MTVRDGHLRMPRIRRISLRSFSLFSKQPDIDLPFGDGIVCLAGANGLGKSTFLATVAYAVTGIVPPLRPKRDFTTVKEYYKSNLRSAPSFFRGRIAPQDMKDASVTAEFSVGPSTYVVTRGFARSNELAGLEVRDSADRVILDTSDAGLWGPEKRHSEYARRVASEAGLANFEQLVFLQHMVLAFDERRHLLFWDDRAIEQALYLAFGVDAKHAEAADNLRKEISRYGSIARNADWQASRLRAERDRVAANADDGSEREDSSDTLAEHRRLSGQLEECQDIVLRMTDEVGAAELDFARTSADYTTLRQEYAEAFGAIAEGSPILAHHPLVRASLVDSRCGLCGASEKGITEEIRTRTSAAQCPLCGSRSGRARPDAKALRRLKQIDGKLAQTQQKVDALGQLKHELRADLANAEAALLQAREELAKFEKAYGRPRSDDRSAAEGILARYDEQIGQLERTKAEHNTLKEQKTKELQPLQRTLERRYSDAERQFVPVFEKLAALFLGIDLGIKMRRRQPIGIDLILSVDSSERRQLDQLSESQRFFLDIALRMALAQYFSADGPKAQLLIDTPEGSLDIAYESNAGEMLAEFARGGHSIVMSANINTSALLLSLAKKCTSRQMTLFRMTPWAELSEVQKQHEKAFDDAYGNIQRQLTRSRR